MRIFLFLILIIFMDSCDKNECKINCEVNSKVSLANEIRSKVAIKLSRDLRLIPCGTGGQMMYQIEMLALSFDYRNHIDIQEGRKLVVAAVNEFISEINTDERIRPYLANYPFEPKNVEIRIFFRCANGREIPFGELSSISFTRGNITYSSFDSKKIRMKTICREPFEEAVKRTMLRTRQYPPHDQLVKLLKVALEHHEQLILLDPHPNAENFDHGFQSPTFAKKIAEHLESYLECNGEYK